MSETILAKKLIISGMHCASCAKIIEKELSKVVGVKTAKVNFSTSKAFTTLDNQEIDDKLLIQAVERAGYKAKVVKNEREEQVETEKIKNKESAILKKDLILSAVLSAPLLIFMALGLKNISLISLILATPIQFFAGRRFYKGAYSALCLKSFNMDSLVAIGTSFAFFYGFFETSALLITFVLLGKYLEQKSLNRANSAVRKLANLTPKTALVKVGKQFITKEVKELKNGDIVIVRAGENIPVDGVVISGQSTVNESALTGESVPREKSKGNTVFAGTVNEYGSIEIETKKVGEETMLGNIIKFVDEAQSTKAPIQDLADKISAYFVPAVLIIATLTFIVWYFALHASFNFALQAFVSVMVISCPCALGLAVPVSVLVGTGKAAGMGILIKGGEAVEKAEKIDTVVFDKTGTLTQGNFSVTDVEVLDSKMTTKDVIKISASLEHKSQHPIAKAIVAYSQKSNLELLGVSDFKTEVGVGVSGKINQNEYVVEKTDGKNGSNLIQNLFSEGKTVVQLTQNGKTKAFIALADTARKEAFAVVGHLKKLGTDVVMITGDNEVSAKNIAEELGITQVLANILPKDKAFEVEKLQKKGKKVAFVGDGINDSPALVQSDLGIALKSGTDIAMESADIVLVRNDLWGVPKALDLSAKTLNKIKQNLFFSFFYNILGIPIAARVLYQSGIVLKPELAGLAMALSSVSVVLNALLLQRYKFVAARHASPIV